MLPVVKFFSLPRIAAKKYLKNFFKNINIELKYMTKYCFE